MDLALSPSARLFLGSWEVHKILPQQGWDLKFVLLFSVSKTSCSGISSGTHMSSTVRRLLLFLHQADESDRAHLEVLNKHPHSSFLAPSQCTNRNLASPCQSLTPWLDFMAGTCDF